MIDAPPAAPGTIRWARSLSSLEALGVADGAGGLVVTGSITAPANLGGSTLVPTGGPAMVVAGMDSDNASHLYSVSYGGSGSAFPFVQYTSANGAPFVYGVSYGATNLGQGQVAGGGSDTSLADGFIGLYGPGGPQWVSRIVGPGEDKIVASAPGPSGSVFGGGWFQQTTNFNGSTLTAKGSRDIFLAQFNGFTGAVQLTKTFPSPGRGEISGAASTSDALIVTGHFDETTGLAAPGTLSFGGSTSPLSSAGGLDIWVAKLDAGGNGVWAVRFGGSGDDRDPRVAVDAAGDVYVAGTFTGQVGFGAINLQSNGGPDVFVAKLHGNSGGVAWAISFGSAAPATVAINDGVGGIAVDGGGRVVVTGRLAGAIDGEPTAGGLDGFITSLDAATGTQRWRKIISSAGDDSAGAVIYGRNGDLYAIVGLGGAVDFGAPLIGAASPAAVALRIAP